MSPKEALDKACRIVGSAAELARRLGIKPQAISQWGEAPPNRVIAIERATSGVVTRSELRPDLYPPDDAASSQEAVA